MAVIVTAVGVEDPPFNFQSTLRCSAFKQKIAFFLLPSCNVAKITVDKFVPI